jgi:hypothetical protein
LEFFTIALKTDFVYLKMTVLHKLLRRVMLLKEKAGAT